MKNSFEIVRNGLPAEACAALENEGMRTLASPLFSFIEVNDTTPYLNLEHALQDPAANRIAWSSLLGESPQQVREICSEIGERHLEGPPPNVLSFNWYLDQALSIQTPHVDENDTAVVTLKGSGGLAIWQHRLASIAPTTQTCQVGDIALPRDFRHAGYGHQRMTAVAWHAPELA